MPTTALSYTSIRIGDEFPPIEHTLTQEVIDRAALAHLDFNPVHTDIEWCKRAQVFGTPRTVGHGMLTMSLMASVIERHWRAAGGTVCGMDSTLTKPVPVGRTLRCEGRVSELHPRGPGQNLVMVAVKAVDDEGDTVAVGNYTVRVPD